MHTANCGLSWDLLRVSLLCACDSCQKRFVKLVNLNKSLCKHQRAHPLTPIGTRGKPLPNQSLIERKLEDIDVLKVESKVLEKEVNFGARSDSIATRNKQ